MREQLTFQAFLVLTFPALQKRDQWISESYLKPEEHEKPRSKSDYDNGLTFSVTWSLGGTSGSCYDTDPSDLRTIDPEMQPDDPPQMDLILEAMCPSLTFMQYKNLAREVMESGQKYHSDYYGGSTTECYRGFHIKKLYDALISRGMLPTVR